MEEYFNNLVENLEGRGYVVNIYDEGLYKFASVTGKGIRAGFCTEHDPNLLESSYIYLNGKISAEHVDCFDKWSKCPLIWKIPKTEEEINILVDTLKYLGTDEAYEKSNNFELYFEPYEPFVR